MNLEKQNLLLRRKQLASIPMVDMQPKEIREYEDVVRRLNEIEFEEMREEHIKRTETGQGFVKTIQG